MFCLRQCCRVWFTRVVFTVSVIVMAGSFLVGCGEEDVVKSTCIRAETTERNVVLRDFEYARNRFFDLGRVTGTDPFWEPGDRIQKLRMFFYRGHPDSVATQGDPTGTAYADVRDTANVELAEFALEGLWHEMGDSPLTEFPYHRDSFYVFFPAAYDLVGASAIAYCMEIRKRDGAVDTIGIVDGDNLKLQILKPRMLLPSEPFWEAEWRNVYDLGIRNIDYDLLDLKIYKGPRGTETNINSGNLDHQDGMPYLQLFGLDSENKTGQPYPDDKVDLIDAILDRESGLLIFPDRHPFDPPPDVRHVVGYPDAVLEEKVPDIYKTQNLIELKAATKYYIKNTIRTIPSRTINLGAAEMVPGSEVVTLNGQKLVRRAQYTVDYSEGVVTLHDNVYLNDASDLSICFDYFADAASVTSW